MRNENDMVSTFDMLSIIAYVFISIFLRKYKKRPFGSFKNVTQRFSENDSNGQEKNKSKVKLLEIKEKYFVQNTPPSSYLFYILKKNYKYLSIY